MVYSLKNNKTSQFLNGFTAIEIVFALSILISIIFLGEKFVNLTTENNNLLEEYRTVDKELHRIVDQLSDDIESMVLLEKNQPIFEVLPDPDGKILKIFFFTTDSNGVTTAVQYLINKIGVGRMNISRIALNAEASLSLQTVLSANASFEKHFDSFDSSQKQTKIFNIQLSDFKIRAAIKRSTKSIVFSPTNVKMSYSNGILKYNILNNICKIPGYILFFDITVRAFTKDDAAKFEHLKLKHEQEAKDFIFANSRKCFSRITPNSEGF